VITRRLTLALLIALSVSGMFTWWLSRHFSKSHGAPAIKRQYVVATQEVNGGETLHGATLKLLDWPGTPLQGAFLKPADLEGRILLYPLAADEPILERQLSAPGSGAGLTAKIPEGMRAISLRSDEIVGVAGFLLPGAHVDVLVTYHVGASSEPISSTVLQDVEILASGQKTQPDPEGKANKVDVITLLVKPQDAEKAVLASTQGSVHFVLRNGGDRQQENQAPIRLSQLSGTSDKPVQRARATIGKTFSAKTYQVQTISGTKQSVDTFSN
jgi:pilus assembly protein CpaB